MSRLPRILTVDPTGEIARLVRGILDITDSVAILTDVPDAAEALHELAQGQYHLLLSAVFIDDTANGYTLAEQALELGTGVGILLLADAADPVDDMGGHIVVLQRPFDAQQLIRLVKGALEGQDIAGLMTVPNHALTTDEHGPIPMLDIQAVSQIIEGLYGVLVPLRMLLATRSGEVLLERGSDKSLDRERLAQALLPAMHSTIQMGAVVGGKLSVLTFYDGEKYDIFVLTVGYHHFLAIVFDGKNGGKQLGAVRSYAQRAAQDIAALLGGQAYTLANAGTVNGSTGRASKAARMSQVVQAPHQESQALIARGESLGMTLPGEEEMLPSMGLQLEPVENFDPSLLDQLDGVSAADADALFDLDTLAEIAKDPGNDGGSLTYDEARKLGIVQ
jgi:hypothetical protein